MVPTYKKNFHLGSELWTSISTHKMRDRPQNQLLQGWPHVKAKTTSPRPTKSLFLKQEFWTCLHPLPCWCPLLLVQEHSLCMFKSQPWVETNVKKLANDHFYSCILHCLWVNLWVNLIAHISVDNMDSNESFEKGFITMLVLVCLLSIIENIRCNKIQVIVKEYFQHHDFSSGTLKYMMFT